jgi:anti-anti-sigma regulatory factor
MRAVAPGWKLELQRGPGWLIVKVRRPDPGLLESAAVSLADEVWSLLERHFVYRLVLELDQVRILTGALVDQLVLLDKRIREQNGVMRLCGLSARNQRVLEARGLVDRFPSYCCLQEAVMGRLPNKPR